MMALLVFKEKLKQFYAKFNIYLVALVKFAVGYLTFYLINSNIGFMERFKINLLAVLIVIFG